GFALPLSDDHHRALRKNVRYSGRLDLIGFEIPEIELDLSEHRGLYVFAELCGHARRFVGPCNDKGLSGAHTGHAFDHVPVYARADAEWEDVGIADVFADEIQYFGFNRNISVRRNNDGAGKALGLRQCERALHGR